MEEVFDVLIIGGGVIGCSVLYKLTQCGYKCALVEKNEHLVSAASSGNSGMFHTGFDAEADTLEEKLIVKSLPLMRDYIAKNKIPCVRTGALMIAQRPGEVKKIQEIFTNAKQKGMQNLRILSKNEVLQLEPNLSPDIIFGGLLLEDEMVVDSCLFAVSLAHNALRNGAKIFTGSEVISLKQHSDGKWRLKMNDATKMHVRSTAISGRLIINAAGLYGDAVDQIGLGASWFRIMPKKGEYIVYGKQAGKLINHIILPVPSPNYKGVLLFPSAYGNLAIGPTKNTTVEKDNPTNCSTVVNDLTKYGENMIPKLKLEKPMGTYAGIRPATQFSDYQIHLKVDRNWITIGGIRSTGFTASLGIAEYVLEHLKSSFVDVTPSNKIIDNKSVPTWWISGNNSYVLDGSEYYITHKLMQMGLKHNLNSKL